MHIINKKLIYEVMGSRNYLYGVTALRNIYLAYKWKNEVYIQPVIVAFYQNISSMEGY